MHSQRGIGAGNISGYQAPFRLQTTTSSIWVVPTFIAHMQQLHCNLTIVCQNCWWLKLFFYLLDVRTSNALVLYNKLAKMCTPTNGTTYTPMNIVTFKMQLVEGLVGRWLDSQAWQLEVMEHVPVHIQGAVCSQCSYCTL
jgi:hypothetical protein